MGSNETNSSNTTNDTEDMSNFEKIVTYKKKKVKLAIKVTGVPLTRRSMNREELEDAKKRLKVMKEADQYVQDMDAMRNTLETNIYTAREKCEDEAIIEVSTTEELEAVQALSSETQMWLEDYGYDADTTLELLENKSLALETSLLVLTGRAIEIEQREQVIEMVDQVLKYVNETVELVKTNRTWVTDEQREVVTNKTDSFAEWWANVTAEQEKKSKKEDPAFTAKEVSARINHLRHRATTTTSKTRISRKSGTNSSGRICRILSSTSRISISRTFRATIPTTARTSSEFRAPNAMVAAETFPL